MQIILGKSSTNSYYFSHKVYHLLQHPFLVVNVFIYFYSGLYLNQASINPDNGNQMSMSKNNLNPSSFAINDNPIDDMGHLSRSLLWESNYSASAGMKHYIKTLNQKRQINKF